MATALSIMSGPKACSRWSCGPRRNPGLADAPRGGRMNLDDDAAPSTAPPAIAPRSRSLRPRAARGARHRDEAALGADHKSRPLLQPPGACSARRGGEGRCSSPSCGSGSTGTGIRAVEPEHLDLRIATNLAIDHWRSRKAANGGRSRSGSICSGAGRRRRAASSRRSKSEVGAIFRGSPPVSRAAAARLPAAEIEGLSSQEVAAIAGCEESTVRNHLFNARKVLRRELVRRYPEYAAGRQERREEAR